MNQLRLVLNNLTGSLLRSLLVFLCIALAASAAVFTTFIIRGARDALRLNLSNMQGLGADILVIPHGSGYFSTGMENVDLASLLENILAVRGVAAASPQQRIGVWTANSLNPGTEVFLIAFDPASDFQVLAQLEQPVEGGVAQGQVVAGSLVAVTAGQGGFQLGGLDLIVAGRLSPTGTSLDQSLYMNFDTARELIAGARDKNELNMDPNIISTILVKIVPGLELHEVTQELLLRVPGVTAFDRENFFQLERSQVLSLLNGIPFLLGSIWLLLLICTGLVFSITVHERRREIGVLRALGSSRKQVLRTLILEGLVLAMTGGLAGTTASVLAAIGFKNTLNASLGLPVIPAAGFPLLGLALLSLGLACLSAALAAAFPAWVISRREPAELMKG